jgi:CubicO group peptidase (beta-lactamase class C family)
MNSAANLHVALAIVLTGFAAHSCYGDAPAIKAESIDPLVQPYIDGEIVNAVSIGVVQDDKSWTRHFGTLSKEANKKPSDSTIYEIGSMSKVFTGILLAHAVESGRVKLDQPIGTLMKELQAANKEVGESILLRHLSTHTSGLPRLPDNMNPADPTNPYADYDRKLLTEFMSRVQPNRKPEVLGEYSNLAAGLLGDLMAAEASSSYEALLKQNIARPLEMTDTCLTLTAEQKSRLAPPHNADRMSDKNWDFDALAGAGAIRSTTDDMLRFIKANLDPPDGLQGKAIELAWKQHFPAKGEAFAMGLGWHVARDGQTRWHNGQTGGYHSMMLISRELDAGVVVLCNTASGQIDALAESIIRKIAGMNVEPAKMPKSKAVAAKEVARLQGRYQIVPQFILTVRADGEELYVQATNQQELRVYPESATEWKYRVVEASLTFELPEKGKCTAVTLHQNGQDMRAPRLDD